MRRARIWFLAAFVLDSASCTSALCQVSAKDAQVIARTMTFLDPAPTGVAEIGILYAPAAPDSEAQANQVAAEFGGGVTVSRLTVRARLVAVASLPDVQGLAAIFVTGGLGTGGMGGDAVAAAARRLHVPTISTDIACVRRNLCTVGLSSTAGVHIMLSHAACQAAGISFIQAFRILVIEQ